MEEFTSSRVRDYALIIGHAWRCLSCREALLEAPQSTWIGYKLSKSERESILALESASFYTVAELAAATQLSSEEIEAAIDHPRARLRHLGSYRAGERRPW